eukprot:15332517-Ditylum_brightwellii.AAC.1
MEIAHNKQHKQHTSPRVTKKQLLSPRVESTAPQATLPPPRPHRLSIPIPKQTGQHVIPLDDEEYRPSHQYNTRNNPHLVNYMGKGVP